MFRGKNTLSYSEWKPDITLGSDKWVKGYTQINSDSSAQGRTLPLLLYFHFSKSVSLKVNFQNTLAAMIFTQWFKGCSLQGYD